MFTVANQKAIAFHFHPSMFVSEQAMMVKAHTLGVYFIWRRIQSTLWPYVNTQLILICTLSSACFDGYWCEAVFCFVVLYVSKQPKKMYFTVYLRKGKKYEKKA